jgi:pimeloyl-ACP methyl ester carboxylesterase
LILQAFYDRIAPIASSIQSRISNLAVARISHKLSSLWGKGAAVILVHGFGASVGHWRKNLPVLGQSCRCYALDLIGFGASAKPTPGQALDYTFETWGQLVIDFCQEVVGEPAFLVGNSIGCIVIMQAAIASPQWVLGIAALNCSLRLLHDRKRQSLPWYRNLGAGILQQILTQKAIGYFFFAQLATPRTVRKILLQAYHSPDAVTDELVELIMQPAYDVGAADVFLAFTAYSQGPLPEDLLPNLRCPTILLWGKQDPWEPIALGRELAQLPTVNAFIELEGAGHCPQDEIPDQVNEIILAWINSIQSQL